MHTLIRTVFALALGVLITACSKSPEQASTQSVVETPEPVTGPIQVESPDGVSIAATVNSTGQTTIVLVHGWMCDQTYWEAQVPALSEHLGVVTVDVAGHGLSGTNRQDWTIASLGDDVAAVISQLQLESVIVAGHSMGGRVGLEVARLLPGIVTGVIGVDTFHDADQEWDPEEVGGILAGFEADFVATCGGFVRSMFTDTAPKILIQDISSDMCSGPGDIGTALIRDYVAYDLAAALQAARVTVRSINADFWPTNVTANEKYADFDALILDGYGHFLMQEAPNALNEALIETAMNLGVND